MLKASNLVTLAALRLEKGLKQSELAARVGILQPQMSRLEAGTQDDVKLSTVERLADALGSDFETVRSAIRHTQVVAQRRAAGG